MSLSPQESPSPTQNEQAPKIPYVLFIDIVGYSLKRMEEQRNILAILQEIVRDTKAYNDAKNAGKLIACGTGDGMALVFFPDISLNAAHCARQICKALQSKSVNFGLRMGIHSGPVFPVHDINGNENVAGEGINTAQRVMDCGDSGHILLSKGVADCLASLDEWSSFKMDDLKGVKVKHDKKVHLFNLHGGEIGNQKLPKKVKLERRNRVFIAAIAALFLIVIAMAVIYVARSTPSKPRATVAVVAIAPDGDEKLKNYIMRIANNVSNKLSIKSQQYLTNDIKSTLLIAPEAEGIARLDADTIIKIRGVRGVNSVKVSVDFQHNLNNHSYNECFEENVDLDDEEERISKYEGISNDVLSSYRSLPEKNEIERWKDARSSNEDAMNAYWDALFHQRRRKEGDFEKAREFYEKATNADNGFALAFVGLANSYLSLGGTAWHPKYAKDPAVKAVETALEKAGCQGTTPPNELNASICQRAYSTRAMITFWLLRDKVEAAKEFDEAKAKETSEESVIARFGIYLASVDRGQALSFLREKGSKLNCNVDSKRNFQNPKVAGTVCGQIYYFIQDYDGAIGVLEKIKKEEEFAAARRFLAQAYEQKALSGDNQSKGPAEELLDKAIAELKAITENKRKYPYDYQDALGALGHVYALKNQKYEAEVIAQGLEKEYELMESGLNNPNVKYVSAYNIAIIYTGLGENEKALQWLKNAIKHDDVRLAWFKVDPRFEKLRKDRGKDQEYIAFLSHLETPSGKLAD